MVHSEHSSVELTIQFDLSIKPRNANDKERRMWTEARDANKERVDNLLSKRNFRSSKELEQFLKDNARNMQCPLCSATHSKCTEFNNKQQHNTRLQPRYVCHNCGDRWVLNGSLDYDQKRNKVPKVPRKRTPSKKKCPRTASAKRSKRKKRSDIDESDVEEFESESEMTLDDGGKRSSSVNGDDCAGRKRPRVNVIEEAEEDLPSDADLDADVDLDDTLMNFVRQLWLNQEQDEPCLIDFPPWSIHSLVGPPIIFSRC